MIRIPLVTITAAVSFCIPVFADAAGPSAGPLQAMQDQIDLLTQQYQALASRLVRPQISVTLSCAAPLSANVRLSAMANQGLAYFAFQEQGGNPPANFVTFVEPGVTNVTRDVDIEPGLGTRTFLFVAADTDGNAAASLLSVPPDACP